jgi:hypothetical protein
VFVIAVNREKNLLKTLNSDLFSVLQNVLKLTYANPDIPKNFLGSRFALAMYLAAFGGSAVGVPSKKYLPLHHCLPDHQGPSPWS